MPHLLIVDDDPEALEWLGELARAEGFTIATADSLRNARIHMARLQPDILLADLQLPDGKGVELVGDLEARETTEVVMITGHATVESVVEALRLGATDYRVKPVDVERLKAILRRVPKTGELRAEIGELRDELRKLGRFGHVLGSSPPMQKMYDQVGRVAPTSATVMLVPPMVAPGSRNPMRCRSRARAARRRMRAAISSRRVCSSGASAASAARAWGVYTSGYCCSRLPRICSPDRSRMRASPERGRAS